MFCLKYLHIKDYYCYVCIAYIRAEFEHKYLHSDLRNWIKFAISLQKSCLHLRSRPAYFTGEDRFSGYSQIKARWHLF